MYYRNKKYYAPALYKTKKGEWKNLKVKPFPKENSDILDYDYIQWMLEDEFRHYNMLHKNIYKRSNMRGKNRMLKVLQKTNQKHMKYAIIIRLAFPNKSIYDLRKYVDVNHYPACFRYYFTIRNNYLQSCKNLEKKFKEKYNEDVLSSYSTETSIGKWKVIKKEVLKKKWNSVKNY